MTPVNSGRGGDFLTPKARALVCLLSGDYHGLEGRPVEVQIDVSERCSPNFTIVGLPGRSTRESRDRIRAAVQNSGFFVPRARILVNLAPATHEKYGTGFDLAVALGILLATRQIAVREHRGSPGTRLAQLGFLGELGLQGELRPVRGALLTADAMRRQGAKEQIVARANAVEVALLDDVAVYGATHLREAIRALCGDSPPHARSHLHPPEQAERQETCDFAEVRGQETTKRGILIAVAGNHNILLSGPPGVGKTMLARRIPGVLPPLTPSEAMEVWRVRSVVEGDVGVHLTPQRPFRAPHHTVSYAGMVGGGAPIRPGEVTRAHRGVLFLDEFPEFSRSVLEALREPLEEGGITIGRSSGSVTFPAGFLLVAAMNPCPCGYLGHPRRTCTCTRRQVYLYCRRISGPLSDRLDIHIEVAALDPSRLLGTERRSGELDSRTMAQQVVAARERQSRRWGQGGTNAQVELGAILKHGQVARPALAVLRRHAERLSLSARGFARVLRVARTVADLQGTPVVEEGHVLEALEFREITR